ncbi:MAG TPA: FtsX-like permease family protein [Acidimicrobiia bacterium]|nr:FtsX-like permease family protein [Acidimicrobiia bacterium]
MWKVTRKGLAAHKLRFALTALAVFLGVAFMSGTMVLTATIQNTFDNLFSSIYHGTDAVVRAKEVLSADFGAGLRPPIPESFLDRVRSAPGVAGASPNVGIPYAQILNAQGKTFGKAGTGPPALGFNWDPNPTLNQFVLQPGSRAPANAHEVVIDKRSADEGHIHVGQTITVLTAKGPGTYTLVGIVKFGSADSPAGASAALFTLPEAQRLADEVGKIDAIAVVANPGVSQDQVQADLARVFSANRDIQVITGKAITKENQAAINKTLGFLSTALLLFALVALVVGSFIIYNTFSIVVAQRSREMALLRAIGASRRQVLRSVLLESTVVGILASGIGILGGIGLSYGLKGLANAIGFDIPGHGVTIHPNAVIVGLVVGTVVTVLSAIVPARQASRIAPVAAIRDVAIERRSRSAVRLTIGGLVTVLGIFSLFSGLFGGSGIQLVGIGAAALFAGVVILGPLFARTVSLWIGSPLPALKGMTGTLARENAARNPKRTSVTATALMIGVALVGFITVFAASTKASFGKAIDNQILGDFVIKGPGFRTGFSPKLEASIAKLPEVAAATAIRQDVFAINTTRHQLIALDPAGAQQEFNFGSVAGTFTDVTPDGIAVSKYQADKHHWRIGTELPVTFVNTGKTHLRVEFIFKQRIFSDFFISIASYDQHFSAPLDNQIFVKLKPGVSPAQGRGAIEPLLAPYHTAQLEDNAQYKSDQLKNLNGLLALVYVLLLFAVLIALVGIANTLALSIHERTREIGLLRAVGMSRRQIRSTVRWESVIIALFGTLLGIAIGLFFGWSVVTALHDQGISTFDPAVPQLVIIVLFAAVSGTVAAILPARRAAKLDVLRAVSTE